MKDPEALKAVADILSGSQDLALQTTLTRWLPDGPDSNAAIQEALPLSWYRATSTKRRGRDQPATVHRPAEGW